MVKITGQTVKVTTKPLAEGTRDDVMYYFVAEADPAKAESIVRDKLGLLDCIVESVAPLPEGAVQGLGLKPGDFTHV